MSSIGKTGYPAQPSEPSPFFSFLSRLVTARIRRSLRAIVDGACDPSLLTSEGKGKNAHASCVRKDARELVTQDDLMLRLVK